MVILISTQLDVTFEMPNYMRLEPVPVRQEDCLWENISIICSKTELGPRVTFYSANCKNVIIIIINFLNENGCLVLSTFCSVFILSL